MTNKHAVVLFFRGTEPAKLLEWWSDADVSDTDLHIHHLYTISQEVSCIDHRAPLTCHCLCLHMKCPVVCASDLI